MRKLGIDYGDSRVGLAITDALNITAQGLETIHHKNNDKVILKRLDEILEKYDIDTFVVGMPINMNGTLGIRAEKTGKFINKLKCKYNKIKIETVDERLTTVQANKTLNFLNFEKTKKKQVIDTLSAQYILETYMKKI
ncbi:MAG: Holliday junction resolvase RuvX [Oscillospiraceae bacterium]|nr:Holliday junction resolvase RuvX [Oscillospiraceae bacterium]